MVAQVRVRVVFNDLPELQRRVPRVVDDAVQAVAREGERIVKQSMQQSPANGIAYDRGAGVHVASSAGNPPRIDTGTLLNSINTNRVKDRVWRVSTGTEYAAWLEFGTERMAARPFMGPMADEISKEAGGIVTRYLRAIM